ncbi:hypothetical protein J6590_049366 [Homalodisca vitripennis]|nr:hypothetical protein J6590_049366 [Homalodisca vitripennis]
MITLLKRLLMRIFQMILVVPKAPKTQIFYHLPKIHKPSRPPPGRLIVASIGSPTERILAFVDDNLQPLVRIVHPTSKAPDTFYQDSRMFTSQFLMR